jgi:hypothetical protein
MWSKTFIGLHVKYPLFLADLNETRISSTNFRKILKLILIYWYICQLQLGWHPVAVHIYTQTILRTSQLTTRITNKTTQITNLEERWPCPVFANYTLAFALQLRKKHGKPSVRVAKEIRSTRAVRKVSAFKIARHCVDLAGRGKCYSLVMSLTNCVAKTALLYLA